MNFAITGNQPLLGTLERVLEVGGALGLGVGILFLFLIILPGQVFRTPKASKIASISVFSVIGVSFFGLLVSTLIGNA